MPARQWETDLTPWRPGHGPPAPPKATTKPQTLAEMGLRPSTRATLLNVGIYTTYRLFEHTCRELIWHCEVRPEQLYEVLCKLDRLGMGLQPTTIAGPCRVGERNLEVFRLRVVEGHTVKEVASRMDITIVRVRQILSDYFGLHGEPPAAKRRKAAARAQPRERPRRGATPSAAAQIDSAVNVRPT